MMREGSYPIRPAPPGKISNPIATRTNSRQFTNSTILKERYDLNKSIDKINCKLKNMRLLGDRSNNMEQKIYCTRPVVIPKKSNSTILNNNLNEFKCRFIRREQPQNNNSKIPVIIEDIKSLNIVVNEQQNGNNSKSGDSNEKKIETKIIAKLRRENVPNVANGEQVKKPPVFIRPNVEKLLQPTIRGAPKDILLKNNIFESDETLLKDKNNSKDNQNVNDSKETTATDNNKSKTKFNQLNYLKKKILSSSSFISKLSDKSSESSSESNLNCFDTDTDSDNHSSTTTSLSNSSKSQSIIRIMKIFFFFIFLIKEFCFLNDR